jgi:hypothetical protein
MNSQNERIKDNQRGMTRVNFETKVVISVDGKDLPAAESKDISLNGIFVNIKGFEVGKECTIKITLSGASSKLRIETKGKVVRVTDSGAGIIFTMIDPDSFLHLLNIIAINTGDYDTVHQEFLKRVAQV